MSTNIKYLDIKPEIKGGNNCRLAKVLCEVSPLRSIRVTPPKDGKGYGYQLPSSSYSKDGETKYGHPLFPKDAAEMQAAVEKVVTSGEGGTFYPIENVDGLCGYVSLDTAQVWIDVTLTDKGTLLFPSAIKKDKDGKEGPTMIIPVKKDDPVRTEIREAIAKLATA